MLKSLRTALLAAGFAVVVGPALAGGMPDYGTKNFAPGGDVPAFFDNPNLSVAPGSPNQTPYVGRVSEDEDYPGTRAAEALVLRHGHTAAAHGASRRGTHTAAHTGSGSRTAEARSARHGGVAASRGRVAESRHVRASHHPAPHSTRTATAKTRAKSSTAKRPTRHAAVATSGRSG